MVDFSGGGVVGMDVNGWMNNQPNAVGGLSAGQINQSLNPYAGMAQAFDPFASGGGFGAQTDYYSGVGAEYGRATGGFGGYGAPNADPFTPVTQSAPNFDELTRVPVKGGSYDIPQSEYNPWSMPATTPEQGPANPAGQVDRGPDLYDGWDPGYSARPQAVPQGDIFNPTVSNGSGKGLDPRTLFGGGSAAGGGRADLSRLIQQGISPPAPAIPPPQVPQAYTGNWFGAGGNVGQSPGMGPGFGGFNNSGGGAGADDFFGGRYLPPDVFGQNQGGG